MTEARHHISRGKSNSQLNHSSTHDDVSEVYDKLTTPNGIENSVQETPLININTHTNINTNTNTNNPDGEEVADVSDLMHGINSFWAIVSPVCITMIIASIVVVNYRNASIEASMNTYLVYNESSDSSGGQVFGESLVNALVIIGVIAVLTFGMALLYKYNCMKFLAGYIMFASAAILSFVGGQLVDSFVNDQLQWVVDWASFVFVMINFGFVGVVAIFYQKGISKNFQNAYLVLVSVILAWEFSMWPEWTTWIFCCMFACYDLCAVLTPCGPLKYLIGLIQEKQSPLPGLLYEADVRDGVGNEQQQQQQQQQQQRQQLQLLERQSSDEPLSEVSRDSSITSLRLTTGIASSNSTLTVALPPITEQQPLQDQNLQQSQQDQNVQLPLTVAESDFVAVPCDTMEELFALIQKFYYTFSPDDAWKSEQVAEKFIDNQERLWLMIYHKYLVCSCAIGEACPIEIKRLRRAREDEDDKTIKLGLGDFIFYSVLVGRAAIFDFSTFAVSFLCIVIGLGGTLFLLSVLHKALPALPISIFLATAFYFWTRYVFIEFCDFTMALGAAF